MRKTVFDLYKVNIFFLFFFLALKNQRIRSPCPGFKNLYKNFFSPDFKVRVKIFWGFATSEKATLSHEILELGSYNNLAQRRMMGSMFYASQNHSTLLCSPHFFGKLRKSEVPEPTQAAIKLLNWVGFGTGTRKLLLRLQTLKLNVLVIFSAVNLNTIITVLFILFH